MHKVHMQIMGGRVVEPKGYIYCFGIMVLLKCVQEERVGLKIWLI